MDIITYALCKAGDKKIMDIVNSLERITMTVVDEVPTVETAEPNKLYLVDKDGDGRYEEYIYAEIDGVPTIIELGPIVDFSAYYTSAQVDALLLPITTELNDLSFVKNIEKTNTGSYIITFRDDTTLPIAVDTTVTENSTNLITSGAVHEAFQELGEFAHTDNGYAFYTPTGTIEKEYVEAVTPTEVVVNKVVDVGELPTATYDSGTKTLHFSAGALPTKSENITVIGSLTASSSVPEFTGNEQIIVSTATNNWVDFTTVTAGANGIFLQIRNTSLSDIRIMANDHLYNLPAAGQKVAQMRDPRQEDSQFVDTVINYDGYTPIYIPDSGEITLKVRESSDLQYLSVYWQQQIGTLIGNLVINSQVAICSYWSGSAVRASSEPVLAGITKSGTTYWHAFMVGTDPSHLGFTNRYQIIAEYKVNGTIYYMSQHQVNPAGEVETSLYNGQKYEPMNDNYYQLLYKVATFAINNNITII